MNQNKSRGFTLIELLVVIAIIGILAVVILAALGQARKSANDAKKAETTRNVMTAIETYMSANNGTYPANIAALVPNYLASDPTSGTPHYVDSVTIDGTNGTYCILSTTYEAKDAGTGRFYAQDGSAGYSATGVCP